MTVYSRCSVEIEATFVLDVEHQVASIQVLHYKEEVLLYEKHITVSVADEWEQISVWERDRRDSHKRLWECGSKSTTVTAVVQINSLSQKMAFKGLQVEVFTKCLLTFDWNVE